MLRCLILLTAAVLPSLAAPDLSSLFNEFGLKETTTPQPGLTAYRFADPTGAFAAAQWHTGPHARPEANYLLVTETPLSEAQAEALVARLPKVVRSSPPPLPAYLPAKGLVQQSQRYILGPQSLAAAEPRVGSETFGFNKGAEGQFAKYRLGGQDVSVLLVAYPTHQIAMERQRAFSQISEASVERAGPILKVAFPKGTPADGLLGQILYKPKFMWAETVTSDTPQDAARMILAIFSLAGVLIVASVLLGFAFGGFRQFRGRFGLSPAQEVLTSLNLIKK